MDLKAGLLYWPQTVPKHLHFPPLRADVRCDVAIVGAGLSGAVTAYTLAKAGLDVVVLDKRGLNEGSTSASTALVLYDIDVPLHRLIQMRGQRAAVESYRCCLETITGLEKLVKEIGGRCDFRARPSLYLASKAADLPDLKKEYSTRKKFGFAVQYFAASDVAARFSFTAPGAIFSADAADINPVKLSQRLLAAAAHRGARIFSHTQVELPAEGKSRLTLSTSKGAKVTASWLVLASGFETGGRRIHQLVKLKSSYAMVSQPVRDFSDWHRRCLIWETARPYFYLRTTADDRIMIGGADTEFANPKKRDRLIPQKTRCLQKKLQKLFPDLRLRPDFYWAGTFGETKDGLPYIGRMSDHPKILYALCYGANGTNFALLAADIIRDQILGRRNDKSRLFGFGR